MITKCNMPLTEALCYLKVAFASTANDFLLNGLLLHALQNNPERQSEHGGVGEFQKTETVKMLG